MISVKDVPARELLDHIAQAVGGAWRTEDGAEELYQPPALAKEEQEASFAVQVEQVKRATVVLASGVPGETELALDVRAVALPYAYRRLSNGKVVPFFASGVAGIASLERRGSPEQSLAGYAMGTERVTTVRLAYGVDLEQRFGMVSNEVDAQARPIPWTELPAPFPEQVRDYLKNNQPPPTNQGKPPPVATRELP